MNKHDKIKRILAKAKGESEQKNYIRIYHHIDGEKVLKECNEIDCLGEDIEIDVITDKSQVDDEYLNPL